MMKPQFSIEVDRLGRIYKLRSAKKKEPKEMVALQDVSLQVRPAELFGVLGPNGAGKTTLIKILTTLLAPSSGRAMVAGFDVAKEPEQVRERINMVSGGESSGYGLLTVRENLWMFAQFYGISTREANERIKKLLEVVSLTDRTNTKSSDLSTGLRQKMNIARGFLTDPQVLFLDEPTLGLDVGAARDVRHFVRRWVDENPDRTLLLTTHYMVEADELCDRVAIINKGQVLACDTPAALKQALQKEAIFQMRLTAPDDLDAASLRSLPGVRRLHIKRVDGTVKVECALDEESALTALIGAFASRDASLVTLQKREPTLEDVFARLVGLPLEEVEDDTPASS
jgi:ABC-2 type transport system ATP-binding protein